MAVLPQPPSLKQLEDRFGRAYKWIALIVVALATIAAVLATSSFNVAVPALGRHFELAQDQVQWAVTSFLAALTVAMLPTPWLLDRFGFRRLFLSANLLFALASVAGALAGDFAQVVLWRTVQGIAAGLLQPLPLLVIMQLFPAGGQGKAHGVLGFAIVLAPAVAPSFAGMLLDHYGWPAVFLMSLPPGILATLLGLFLLPRAKTGVQRPFDWIGVGILCAVSLLAIKFVADLRQYGLLSPWTLAVLGLMMLCAFAFVRHARSALAPIVSLALFRDRCFSMGAVVGVIYGLGLYASTYLIPVFLQNALHYEATYAGLALLPAGLVLAVSIPLAGVLTDRYSPRWITVIGMAVFGLSYLPFAIRGELITYWEVIVYSMIGRFGLGLTIPALTVATLSQVLPAYYGQASMVSNYTRQFGGALGVAVAAVFVEWRMAVHATESAGTFLAYGQAFVLMTLIFAVAIVAALRMKPRT